MPIAAALQTHAPRFFPWVILESCRSCGDCVEACPRQVLALWKTRQQGRPVAWMSDVEGCHGCGHCEMVCSQAAITLTAYVDEARQRFQTAARVTPP